MITWLRIYDRLAVALRARIAESERRLQTIRERRPS